MQETPVSWQKLTAFIGTLAATAFTSYLAKLNAEQVLMAAGIFVVAFAVFAYWKGKQDVAKAESLGRAEAAMEAVGDAILARLQAAFADPKTLRPAAEQVVKDLIADKVSAGLEKGVTRRKKEAVRIEESAP